jgi:16S rRNA processing protein RimM
MGQEESRVVIGRIGAPFGVKGWVHVQSFTEPPENLLTFGTWQLKIRDGWQAMKVLQARAQGKHFVAELEGVLDRDAAMYWTNAEIAVERETLPPLVEGEYYWTDLIGLSVFTETGQLLGVIDSLFETGANDVIVVKGETKEHLIPYVPEDYVLEIDLKARTMKVNWDPEF